MSPYTLPDTVVLRFPSGVKIKLYAGHIDITIPSQHHEMHDDTLAYIYDLYGGLWSDAADIYYTVARPEKSPTW